MRVISVSTSTRQGRRLRIENRPKDAESSFDSFYRQEYPAILAIARALAPQKGQAEDLVQDAFIAAHSSWSRISGYDQPRLWVRRVLINKATSHRRRLGSELRAVARIGAVDEPGADEGLSEPTREVWEAVRRLPRRQRQVVALHYVGELSVAEIAETLGCSEGTVKAHLHRARQNLKASLTIAEDFS